MKCSLNSLFILVFLGTFPLAAAAAPAEGPAPAVSSTAVKPPPGSRIGCFQRLCWWY